MSSWSNKDANLSGIGPPWYVASWKNDCKQINDVLTTNLCLGCQNISCWQQSSGIQQKGQSNSIWNAAYFFSSYLIVGEP